MEYVIVLGAFFVIGFLIWNIRREEKKAAEAKKVGAVSTWPFPEDTKPKKNARMAVAVKKAKAKAPTKATKPAKPKAPAKAKTPSKKAKK